MEDILKNGCSDKPEEENICFQLKGELEGYRVIQKYFDILKTPFFKYRHKYVGKVEVVRYHKSTNEYSYQSWCAIRNQPMIVIMSGIELEKEWVKVPDDTPVAHPAKQFYCDER